MKSVIRRTLIAFFALGLCAGLSAESKREYPQISLVGPSRQGAEVSRDEFVILVIEGPFITHEKTRIPTEGLVDYVNNTLKAKGASYLGVYIREGLKYGDVVRALDTLRETNAKSIAVNMVELSAGKEP